MQNAWAFIPRKTTKSKLFYCSESLADYQILSLQPVRSLRIEPVEMKDSTHRQLHLQNMVVKVQAEVCKDKRSNDLGQKTLPLEK